MNLRKLTKDDVTVTVKIEEEEESPRKHFADGGENEEEKRLNREMISEIEERLARGDTWAFCWAEVVVSWNGFSETAGIGCCSYADEADFRKDGYFSDMVDEAIDGLNVSISETFEKLKALIEPVRGTDGYKVSHPGASEER